MTVRGPRGPRDLIVLAGSKWRAERHAERVGVPVERMLWPRDVLDLRDYPDAAVYVDLSLWNHPEAEALAEWFAARLRAAERRRAVVTRFARAGSKELN